MSQMKFEGASFRSKRRQDERGMQDFDLTKNLLCSRPFNPNLKLAAEKSSVSRTTHRCLTAMRALPQLWKKNVELDNQLSRSFDVPKTLPFLQLLMTACFIHLGCIPCWGDVPLPTSPD